MTAEWWAFLAQFNQIATRLQPFYRCTLTIYSELKHISFFNRLIGMPEVLFDFNAHQSEHVQVRAGRRIHRRVQRSRKNLTGDLNYLYYRLGAYYLVSRTVMTCLKCQGNVRFKGWLEKRSPDVVSDSLLRRKQSGWMQKMLILKKHCQRSNWEKQIPDKQTWLNLSLFFLYWDKRSAVDLFIS